MLRSSANWSVTCVVPCELVELIESRPAIAENWRSSGVATEAAIVSGLAPGQARRDLDRREVDVREVAHGQRAEADRAEQEDPGHDERRHDGPPDEGLGDAHPLVLFSAFISTFAPGKRRSWPSVTTRSPAARPFAIATTPSADGPVFTGRGSTVRSSFTT